MNLCGPARDALYRPYVQKPPPTMFISISHRAPLLQVPNESAPYRCKEGQFPVFEPIPVTLEAAENPIFRAIAIALKLALKRARSIRPSEFSSMVTTSAMLSRRGSSLGVAHGADEGAGRFSAGMCCSFVLCVQICRNANIEHIYKLLMAPVAPPQKITTSSSEPPTAL